MTLSLPTIDAIGNLTSTLLGKSIKVDRCPALVTANIRATATYYDSAGELAFLAVSDMAFLAGVGAALAMVPPPTVVDAIRTNKPPQPIVDNAYEVFNVLASLFNDAPGAAVHVKVRELSVGALKPDLAKRLLKPGARLDLVSKIPSYPDGKLGLVALR